MRQVSQSVTECHSVAIHHFASILWCQIFLPTILPMSLLSSTVILHPADETCYFHLTRFNKKYHQIASHDQLIYPTASFRACNQPYLRTSLPDKKRTSFAQQLHLTARQLNISTSIQLFIRMTSWQRRDKVYHKYYYFFSSIFIAIFNVKYLKMSQVHLY